MPHDVLLDQMIGPSVLLVEDNPDDQLLLQLLLEESKGTVFGLRIATSLAEAVALAEDSPPTIILLDLNLPDSTGLTTLTRLRHAVPGVAIVVLTGDQEEQLAVAAVREGAQDFLVKGRVDAWGMTRTLRYALERQRMVSQLESARATEAYRATHDALTGLPNGVLFHDRLNHALAQSARHGHHLAVVFIDLDGFKAVNDTQGHAAGDALLTQVAARLSPGVRTSDTLARLGGDEFAVVFEQVPDRVVGLALAEALRARLAAPFEVDGIPCAIGASLGVALFPSDGTNSAALLRHADASMYRDKSARRGGTRGQWANG